MPSAKSEQLLFYQQVIFPNKARKPLRLNRHFVKKHGDQVFRNISSFRDTKQKFESRNRVVNMFVSVFINVFEKCLAKRIKVFVVYDRIASVMWSARQY